MKWLALMLLVLAGCASQPIERGTIHYEVPQFEYERQ